MIKLLRTAAFLLCTAVAAPAMAQDFDKGRAAALAGDFAIALQEWRPLAEQGNADAQRGIGRMYARGDGVPQDYSEAAKWYRLAVEQGHAWAQVDLAQLYRGGHGVPQDLAQTVDLYRKAAEQGYALAQYRLGFLYESGEGVLQHFILAHMWYNIANANGNGLGSEYRGKIENYMTREQIAEAQARARLCMSSNYQDCD
jgi:TPR repeat protein